MDAIQGAKNQALFRDAADERLQDLNEAFERVMGKTEAPADALSRPSDSAPAELSREAGCLPMTDEELLRHEATYRRPHLAR